MARPASEEIAWVSAELAMRALEKAAAAEPRLLAQAFVDWFPDADGSMQRAEMAAGVATALRGYARLIQQRMNKMVARGDMRKPGSTPDGEVT